MLALYIILTLLFCGVGTIAGVGGGVILKPVMDLIGDYDAVTISIMLAGVVFAMTLVSLVRSLLEKKGGESSVSLLRAVFAGVGSIIGGYFGTALIATLMNAIGDNAVKLGQSIVLALFVIAVLVYNNLKNPKKLSFDHPCIYFLVGLFLGFVSVFFRAPVNVVVLIFFFGLPIKKAAAYSLIITLFSQASTLIATAVSGGFSGLDLQILPYLLVCAVVGAIVGVFINKKVSQRTVRILYSVMQGFVLCLVILNIVLFATAL